MPSTMSFSTCDIFKSSTFHTSVHCLPIITLLAMHWSYMLIVNPQLISVSNSNFQKSDAACSIPYKAFFNCKYCIGLPFLSCHTYFKYIVGSSLTTCSAIVSYIVMWTLSFMSACSKASGISITTTYLPSFVSMQHEIMIASRDIIGELTSSLSECCCCGLPSAHPLAFTVPSHFSLINIKNLSAFCLSSSVSFTLTIAFL